MSEAVHAVGSERGFDSAIEWASSLPAWDGVPRVESFCSAYLGADDTPYTRAVGRYLWSALAGRTLAPGCKADMVMVMVGKQGVGKSSAAKALVASADAFFELRLNERDADAARKMRGKQVIELGELRGLRSRDAQDIKDFLVRQTERWIPKYRERETTFDRRCVFIGTTNEDEFLDDPTGERRWLPVKVTACNVDKIKADRDQLWAEGITLFRSIGIDYAEAEKLGDAATKDYKVSDAWDDRIAQWLKSTGEDEVTSAQVLEDALFILPKDHDRAKSMRVGSILRRLGWERKFLREKGGGSPRWCFVRPGAAV